MENSNDRSSRSVAGHSGRAAAPKCTRLRSVDSAGGDVGDGGGLACYVVPAAMAVLVYANRSSPRFALLYPT